MLLRLPVPSCSASTRSALSRHFHAGQIYVQTPNGKVVRGPQSAYRRNGTLNLFAALHVATGQVTSKTTARKKRPDFQAFMDDLVKETPLTQEVHVIVDNCCTHKKNNEW